MADQTNAIEITNVSKTFKLPHEKQTSIKSAIIHMGRSTKGFEKQQVLDDISFEVKKGEFFGIVGRNGSGKSTLLKLIAGIYSADKGHIAINGSLTPFIELGVGFNPELTGRENVFLNGALLGFNRTEMNAMYDDIVAFSELEKFMDQKLKNYSSGMQVRLAFAIAIKAQSDMLILDEVLAVGDEAFQQKCINVFEKYKARNQTIVLVTHDMATVQRFCDRAMFIQDGKIVKIGNPSVVANMYSETNREEYSRQRTREEANRISQHIDIKILDPATGKQRKRFAPGDEVLARLTWERDGVQHAGVALYKQSGEYVFGPNTYKEKREPITSRTLDYRFTLNVGVGEYYLKAGLFADTDKTILEFVDEGPAIIVETEPGRAPDWEGLLYLPHSWK